MSLSIPYKVCSKCKQPLPATNEYFSPQKGGKYGLKAACKPCSAAYHKTPERKAIISQQNKTDAHKATRKTYRQRPEVKQKASEYARGDKAKESALEYRARPEVKAQRKQQASSPERLESKRRYRHSPHGRTMNRRYAQSDRGKGRQRIYLQSEKGKLMQRAASQRRRALERNAPGSHNAQDIELQFRSQNGLCWWCEKSLSRYHVDHVIPLSRGGSNDPQNLVISCPSCNDSKGAKLPQEWIGRLS